MQEKDEHEQHSIDIWTEKYRPKTFDEIIGQKEIINKIKAFVKSGNMPHLLFVGPAGVGKTTTALVIVKTIFGKGWRENLLELNASDERGIDVIRVKVKDFARTKAIGDVPYKIIYLDECDALTRDAQQALRRTMENYTSTCRFILSANYSSKIIDPIQSRCAVFRFKPLSKEEVLQLVDNIAKNEGLKISNDARDAIYDISNGDCRRVENILQSCAALQKEITRNLLYTMAAYAQPEEIKKVLELAFKQKFIEARDLLLKVMLSYGLSGLDIIKQIQKEMINLNIEKKQVMEAISACGEAEFRMVEGSDEYVQLEALLAKLAVISEEK